MKSSDSYVAGTLKPAVHGEPEVAQQVRGRQRPAWLSSLVVVILILVTVTGYIFAKRSTDQQEQALLQGDSNQAAAYASQILDGLGTSLGSTAALVKVSSDPVAAFTHAEPANSPLTTLLVRKTGSAYVVAGASGKGFSVGEALTGPTLSTVQRAGSKLTAGPVTSTGTLSTARFALGGSTTPTDLVVYEQFQLNPYTATPVTTGKPFDQLNATLYGSGPPSPHNLLISTSKTLPLAGPVARSTVSVGSSNWTLISSARHSLIGGYAKASAVVLLVLGLVIAFVVGVAVEILHRRQRYAREQVKERTAELEASLENLELAQSALVRGERLAAVGEMATVVGHELRNPLAAVTNALFLIRSQIQDPMSDILSRNLMMAERETRKATTLADDLTAFVRPREMERARIPVEGLVEEVLSVTPPPPGVELITDVEPMDLLADRGQMAEVLTNLITNAYQAIPDGGTLHINAHARADGIHLEVEDTGPGVDEALADRVFEPFFTTKYSGTGLGLAIVQRLVAAHGGHVMFENVPTGGARVTVLLPDQREMAPA